MTYSDLLNGRVSLPNSAYFVTVATHQRRPEFRDLSVARTVIREMQRLHEENELESVSWVLMPDHLHWLFVVLEKHDLSDVVKRFKGRSAQAVNKLRGSSGALWQREFYDRALRKEEDLREVSRYVVRNPLRAGLTDDIGNYPYWDAIWLW